MGQHFHTADSRRLYTSGTGFTDADAPGPLDGVDYTATARFGPNRIRGESAWFGRDYSKSLQGVNVPVVAHELGQWCSYPNYDIIKKFTGYMRPGNYEIFRDSLAAHGLLDKDKDFAWASGRFQLACYKEEIEANLRHAGPRRVPIAGLARLHRTGHGVSRPARHVLGIKGLCRRRKSSAASAIRRCRWRGCGTGCSRRLIRLMLTWKWPTSAPAHRQRCSHLANHRRCRQGSSQGCVAGPDDSHW